jgi:hypothetical protein
VLCIEGSLLRGPRGTGGFHRFGGGARPMIEWVRQIAGPRQARGRRRQLLGLGRHHGGRHESDRRLRPAIRRRSCRRPARLPDFRDPIGLPVINVAGCPPHPDWITETLAALAHGQAGRSISTMYGRPRFFADQLVHHGCPRNEYYEFKASAAKHSDQGCLMEQLGCKGTQAHADCNQRLWNGEGSCLRGGYACIRCTDPGLRGTRPPFETTPKVAGIPDRPAGRHAQGLVRRAGRPVKVGDPGARARERHADHLLRAPSVKRGRNDTRRVLGTLQPGRGRP